LALSPFLMIVICMLTDVFASLALVHEKAESNIMKRRPRNPTKDRLVDWKLLLYSYLFIGTLECTTAFLIFTWHMSQHGYGVRDWLLTYSNFPTDPYTTEVVLEGQSIFFVVLFVLQVGNLFTTRTRYVPTLPLPNCLIPLSRRDNCCNRNCNKAPKCECCHRRRTVSPETPAIIINEEPEGKEANEQAGPEEDIEQSTEKLVDEHVACPELFRRGSRNVYVFMALTASLLSAVFFTEIKACQDTLATRHVEAKYWFVSAAIALLLFFIGEMRKWVIELWPKSIIAKVAW